MPHTFLGVFLPFFWDVLFLQKEEMHVGHIEQRDSIPPCEFEEGGEEEEEGEKNHMKHSSLHHCS